MTFLEKIEKSKKLIEQTLQEYDNPIIAFSGGKDSAVVLDLVYQVKPDIEVLVVLSDTEFPETYKYIRGLKERYPKININWLEYSNFDDDNVYIGLENCCRENKVETFRKALEPYNMWFSGIRRDEGITRADFKYIEIGKELVKVNPILDFTEKDVWHYIGAFGIPVNEKYKDGYRSLSCRKCSTIEQDENEDERAGRWQGTENEGKECGIHTKDLSK